MTLVTWTKNIRIKKSDMLSMNEVYRLRPHYLGILCQSQNTKIYVNDTHTRYHDKLYSLTTPFIDFIDLSIFRIFLFDNFPFLPKYTFRNNLFCILPILPLIFIIVSVYRFFSLWICPIWTKSFYVWNIFVSVNFVFVFFSFFLFCKCSFCFCTCARFFQAQIVRSVNRVSKIRENRNLREKEALTPNRLRMSQRKPTSFSRKC